MNKPSIHSELNNTLSLTDRVLDHPWVDWVTKNKQVVLYTVLALFAVMILAFRFASSKSLQAESDYLQAKSDYTRLQGSVSKGNVEQSQEILTKIQYLLGKHPELNAEYDASISQLMIIEGNSAAANTYANKTFQRVKDEPVAQYDEYAKTSLLISEGRYEDAFNKARSLKETLINEGMQESSSVLYVFNLIRLAILAQQLNKPIEEKQAWADLQQYKGNVEAVLAVQQLYKEGSTSLSHYANERNKSL